GLGPVRHAELAVDVGQVELDGLLGHPELLADRLVREPARDRREDRRLTLGQTGGTSRIVAGLGEPDRAVDGSLYGLAECRRQVDRVDALDDVGAGAALQNR